MLVLISPQNTLAFSFAYACAYVCAYLTSYLTRLNAKLEIRTRSSGKASRQKGHQGMLLVGLISICATT